MLYITISSPHKIKFNFITGEGSETQRGNVLFSKSHNYVAELEFPFTSLWFPNLGSY